MNLGNELAGQVRKSEWIISRIEIWWMVLDSLEWIWVGE